MALYGNDPSAGYELYNNVGTQVGRRHAIRITLNGFNRYMGSQKFRGLPWKEKTTSSVGYNLKYVISVPHVTTCNLTYAIKATGIKTRTLTYTIKATNVDGYDLKYSIKHPIGVSCDIKYYVTTSSEINNDIKYSVINDVSVSYNLKYTTISLVSATRELEYAITPTGGGGDGNNVLLNGDFETGDFTNWNTDVWYYGTDADAYASITGWAARSGNYGLRLVAQATNDGEAQAGIYQAVSTASLQIVDFWYQVTTMDDTTGLVAVQLDCVNGGLVTIWNVENPAVGDWINIRVTRAEIDTIFNDVGEELQENTRVVFLVYASGTTSNLAAIEVLFDDLAVFDGSGGEPEPETEIITKDLTYTILASKHTDVSLQYKVKSRKDVGYGVNYKIRASHPKDDYLTTYRVVTTHIVNDGEAVPTIHSASHDNVYAPWNGRTSHVIDFFDRTTPANYTGKYYLAAHDTVPALSSPWWAIFDYGSAVLLDTYRLMPYIDYAPTSWTFAGSNNASDWLTLHTVAATTWSGGDVQDRTYTFSSATPYRYYKWNITGMVDASHFNIFKFYTYPAPITLQYVVVPNTFRIMWLQYVIRKLHRSDMSLKYVIYSVHTRDIGLTYHVSIAKTKQLTYYIDTVHRTDLSLEYIVPYIIMSAAPTTGIVPLNVTFTVTADNIPSSWTWTWDFGDTNINSSGTTRTTRHQYISYGSYTVVCTAATTSGPSARATLDIVLTSSGLPTNEFYFYVYSNKEVVFYNYCSGADSYNWDFGDGSTHSIDVNPTHVYAIDDTYYVTLIATNGTGSTSLTKEVRVNVLFPAPIADFELEWTPEGGKISVDVTLTVTDTIGRSDTITKTVMVRPGPFTRFKDLSTGNIKYWEWDFGDET